MSSLPSRARPPSGGYQTAPPLPHRQRAPAAEPGQDRGPSAGNSRPRPSSRASVLWAARSSTAALATYERALMDERGDRPLGFGADTGFRE